MAALQLAPEVDVEVGAGVREEPGNGVFPGREMGIGKRKSGSRSGAAEGGGGALRCEPRVVRDSGLPALLLCGGWFCFLCYSNLS